eukprot:CAMPEP_0198200866 /NCGR_PEP_ID=MMETSP1445-20131203/3771_1 /TAXON_ID=36898 /ORGANISM="Pyramimonas sp., Strain CCMP2087" /LENGTH=567 /DNA_ID=CAMNT_0043871029 /DNA_START=155 /DNA_END=1858 /DNA_ORIENTATION=+
MSTFSININSPSASDNAKADTLQAWRFSAHKPIWAFTILLVLYVTFVSVYYSETDTTPYQPAHWTDSPAFVSEFIWSDDPAITYMGRVHKDSRTRVTYMDNSGVAFGFKIKGSRNIMLRYAEAPYNNSVVSTAFRVWIDNIELPKLLISPKLNMHKFIWTMLDPTKTHTIYFQKVSDLTSAFHGTLYGFQVEPNTVFLPLDAPGDLPVARDVANFDRRLEFMGGSWASGYAANQKAAAKPSECWGGVDDMDVTRGYQVVAARQLNAQYHMPAVQSASGLLRSFGGFANQFMEPSHRMFNSALMEVHSEWYGFEWWVPHAVVIAHGPNDFSDNYCKYMTTQYVLNTRGWNYRQLLDSLMTGQDCDCDDGLNRTVITKLHSLFFGGASADGNVLYPGERPPAMPESLTPSNAYYYQTMVDQIHLKLAAREPNATWWKKILSEEVGSRAGCLEVANKEKEAAGYVELVQHIRAKYPDKTKTKIVFACEVSTVHHMGMTYNAGPERSCDAMADALTTLGGSDQGVLQVDLSEAFISGGEENGWACMLHPVRATHQKAAQKLAAFLDNVVNW